MSLFTCRTTSRLEIARQKNRPGDILALACDTPIRALRVEAFRAAGSALLKLRSYEFALEQFDEALTIKPDDKSSREKKGVCLGRTGRHEEAREWVRRLIQDHPDDAECQGLAGRIEKSNWIERWRRPGRDTAQMRVAAGREDASLVEAFEAYHKAFAADPRHHYSGVNALGLLMLREHLGAEVDRGLIERLRGGARWACVSAQQKEPLAYWPRASQADLSLLDESLATVQREFGKAVAAAGGDSFALDSTRQTLLLLLDLEFRPAEAAAALAIVEREIAHLPQPAPPHQVFLFSGHRVDPPERTPSRFPMSKAVLAGEKIGEALDRLGAGEGDLALCQASAGGDLLFLEACQQRRVSCQVLLPFKEPEFIERSILPSAEGAAWRDRYFAVTARLSNAIREMPDELGPLPPCIDPYERCNLWLLHTALAFGADKVRFICLWNGAPSDGPGGTRHMYEEVKRRTGRVTWLNPEAW